MKKGRSLQELAKEIERQRESKKDFLADTNMIAITPEGNLGFKGNENVFEAEYGITEHAHRQISDRLSIPKKYYDRMRNEAPELYANNVNHWLENNSEKRTIRTLDGNVRAFLSDRYRSLDNYDLMQAALPQIVEKEAEIISCEVTETKLYIKVLYAKIEAEIKKGDIVQSGIVISNSEVGAGSVRVEPLIYRLVCLNGMIANTSMKKYHVGRGQGNNFDSIQEILSDATKIQSDKAFWMQVRDVIDSAFNKDIFMGHVEKLREAAGTEPIENPQKAIEIVKKSFGFTDEQGQGIMEHLLRGGDLTKYGMANSITRRASDEANYDNATELERFGGKIIELPQYEWNKIAKAQ